MVTEVGWGRYYSVPKGISPPSNDSILRCVYRLDSGVIYKKTGTKESKMIRGNRFKLEKSRLNGQRRAESSERVCVEYVDL